METGYIGKHISYQITQYRQEYLKSLIMARIIQAQAADRAHMLLWKSEARTEKLSIW